jgi:hypothetical protein
MRTTLRDAGSPRIITGRINGDGTKAEGPYVTSAKESTGVYRLRFNGLRPKTVIATPITNQGYIANTDQYNVGDVRVVTMNASNSAVTDLPFSFTAELMIP